MWEEICCHPEALRAPDADLLSYIGASTDVCFEAHKCTQGSPLIKSTFSQASGNAGAGAMTPDDPKGSIVLVTGFSWPL